ncbi:GNAT family N-acetyltransferase [Spirillospora sp. NPDC047279]|uniref:GNAT family N-acetyltransferase n=1 Tax=Spirillospora sp. NPDC047279 TaxID=3155478 RepID=UPI0033D27EF8
MTDPRQAALSQTIPAMRVPMDGAVTDPRRAALGRISATRIPVDGAVVDVRPTVPADRDEICELHLRCSATTRYHRYHSGLRQPTASMLHHMTDRGKGVYLAVHEPEGPLVGLCGLAFTEEPCTVELGLLVADDWQGRGIGRAVCVLLLRSARSAGFERVTAHLVAENRRAVAFVSRLRATATDRSDPRVISMVFALNAYDEELV